jgi:aminoglycoside/choline kinase family phosphotransferase
MTDFTERAARLFAEHFGAPPVRMEPLAADGSSRSYVRLVGGGGETAIGGMGPDPEENRAFLSFSRALGAAGLRVPEIYADDVGAGVWLSQDLGDTTLLDALTDARLRTSEAFPEEMRAVFGRVLEELVRLQIEGSQVVDFQEAYPRADFDAQSILWDLNYFKYHFLKLAGVPFNEDRLELDFRRLSDFLLEADAGYFVHRDFQSRNIMLVDGEPWFIDYQGGRRGALQYDVASLLYSGSSALPAAAREDLLQVYLDALEARRGDVDRREWKERYRGYALVRVMQAMGTYGFRGLFEKRARFLRSVPAAAASLRELSGGGLPVPLPELAAVFGQIVERWEDASPKPDSARIEPGTGGSSLTVHLSSFSYRGGYPEDTAGHGGGFVFDCRSLPNPGREEAYRHLSGLDAPVVDYLGGEPVVGAFWENARALIEAGVATYLQRGFSDLSVAFGCTGGQHRSVYFVERTAHHLRDRFPDVDVRIRHREAPLWTR